MSGPREDANCLNCDNRKTCGMFTYKKYDENGKPPIDCYGYAKEMTEDDFKNSNWGNLNRKDISDV